MKKMFFILVSLFLVSGCEVVTNQTNNFVKLEITESIDKTTYYVDEAIDMTGFVLTAVYERSSKIITDYIVKVEMGTPGTVKVRVECTVNGKLESIDFEIEILEIDVQVKIDSLPKKLSYLITEEIDYTGLSVSVDSILTNDYTTSYEKKVGTVEVKVLVNVNDEIHELTFNVTFADVLDNISISSLPAKLTYYYGEQINLTGLVVTASYSTYEITVTGVTATELFAKETTIYLEVTVEGEDYELSYEITFVEANYISFTQSAVGINLKDPSVITGNPNYSMTQKTTISSVKYGGARGTNEIVLYDASNIRSRNAFGYEIACNAMGIVIERNVNVDLPVGGFIISGHDAGGTTLSKNLQIGDYVAYDKQTLLVTVSVHEAFSSIMMLVSTFEDVYQTYTSAHADVLPLDYITIGQKLLEAESLFNSTIDFLAAGNYLDITQFEEDLEMLLLEVSFLAIPYQAVENAGFWHYPFRLSSYGFPETNLSEVRYFLDHLVKLGINDLVVNTNIGGFAMYKSDYLPTNLQLRSSYNYGPYGNDYLACLIAEAHNRGIMVTAWTQTLMCGDGYLPNHINKEWVQKDYSGNYVTGVYYYDILNDDVQELLINVYTELAAKYDIDCFEYDIIRFPVSRLYQYDDTTTPILASQVTDSGYTTAGMNKFSAIYGISANLKDLILTSNSVRKNWQNFKRAQLTSFVGNLSAAIRTTNPNIVISGAVIPGASSASQVYMQEWKKWAELGYLDYVEPMHYTPDAASLLTASNQSLNSLSNSDCLFIGGISPILESGNLFDLADQIAVMRNMNSAGYILFSSSLLFKYGSLVEALVTNRPLPVSSFLKPGELIDAYRINLLHEITSFYVKVDSSIDFEPLVNLLLSNPLDLLEQIDFFVQSIANSKIKVQLSSSLQHIEYIIN